MDVKDALENIRTALADVESNGQKLVSTDALRNYLDSLEIDAGISSETRKLRHESTLAQYKAEQDQSIAMFNSVIGFAQAALKTCLLINGAATIALLTFIGNIWSKSQTVVVAKLLSASLALFAIGVLVAALATATTYITQWCYSASHFRTAYVFHITTVVLVLGSFVMFGFGVWQSYGAFISHLSP